MAALAETPVELLAEEPVDPPMNSEGVPMTEKTIPTVEVPAPRRSTFTPSVVRRADVDAAPLVALLSQLGEQAWDPDLQAQTNVPFNRPAHDRWGVGKVMLIHCDDFMMRKYIMPWWNDRADWKQVVEPFFEALGVPTNRVVRCLLARLPPKTTIPVHHDTGLWVQHTHRLHVPIATNDRVVFRAGMTQPLMQRYRLDVGGIFELNNQSKHYVSNWGDEPRVHLIFDYVDDDAMVPPVVVLKAGEVVNQTRRSIDPARLAGSTPCPTFCIIGAQKSGTTSVYEYLHQHPLVIRGVRRESHFFDWRWNHKAKTRKEQLESFHAFFDYKTLHDNPSAMAGDSTPSYLLHSDIVIPRIKAVAPWMKLIACFRDPVKRAYSHYQMAVDPNGTPAQLKVRGRSNWIGKSFEQVIDEEMAELKSLGITAESPYTDFKEKYLPTRPMGHGGHSLLARGMYALQLEPWLEAFPREQLYIVYMEELAQDSQAVMDRVFDFVGLPPERLVDASAKNSRSYEKLDESSPAFQKLREFYAPHEARLRSLLGTPDEQ